MTPVTDPAILKQLNGDGGGLKPVTDPAILAQLNGERAPSSATEAASAFLAKKPGWKYGSVLPLATDESGGLHAALPDIIREPIQSALGSANKLEHGEVPQVSDYMPAVLATVGAGIRAPTAAVKAAPAVVRTAPAASAAAQKVDDLARSTIDKFAGGAPSLDTRQIIPGSVPTMAEASTDNNLGIAGLQRTVRDLVPNSQIAQRETANAKARGEFYGQLAGTTGDLESAKLARDAITEPMRTAAFAKAGPADSSSVDRTIGRILSSPAGQRDAVSNVLQDIRAKLQVDNPLSARISDAMGPIQDELGKAGISQARRVDLMEARRLLGSASRGYTPEDELTSALGKLAAKQKIVGPIDNALSVIKSGDTAFESDPEQLYGIRKAITDRLSPLARGTAKDARVAASELQPVLKAIDSAIETAAPGYKDYMAKFSELSKPVDQMEYLQSLNLVDQRGNITLAKVQNALRNISQQRKAGGVNQAKSLTDDHIQQLESLRDDLMAGNNITLGKAVGSNTVQNIASQKALERVLPGKLGAIAGRYVRPEVAGGAIGGTLGSIFGPGGAMTGAGIGTGIGNIVNRGMEAKNAAVLSRIEEMLVDPRIYANKPATAGAARVGRLPPGALNNMARVNTGTALNSFLSPPAEANRQRR